ncbi:YceI family protein [Pseudonocardia ailaonensis]|uniref:YceI family protein n=1 Tax=Pseudonocardia ailaonensis TaxID=367279 RepID=A0ABN2MRY2_9PSEU
MTTTTLAPPTRWTVDPTRSRLTIGTRIGGLLPVRGRFTDVAGRIRLGAAPADSRIEIAVRTGSLTSGNAATDRMLHASGLVDPAAGPVLRFRSTRLVAADDGWLLDGELSTERGSRPLRLGLRCRHGATLLAVAGGEIDRADVGFLLARPGAEALLGARSPLDLRIEAAPVQTS